jgi:hypothetical protein
MESDVFGRLLDERLREEVTASKHAVEVTAEFKTDFDTNWRDDESASASARQRK